jgi:multidrug efflux pump subunit AcrB
MLRYNGRPSIGIAISTISGGNVVTMGEAVEKRLEELTQLVPIGMDLEVVMLQSETVVKSIQGFVINLLEAVAIVVVVLLFAMGLRSGLIIGFILLLTIAATFVVMGYYKITLERISLGALIIALGMLVDNAIVVVDGMKVRMEDGEDGLDAAKAVVGQNSIPLLGATAVAVLAFASIGGMNNGTGEYCRSLYYVILISLSLSWFTAVTTTPLLTNLFVLPRKSKSAKKNNKKSTGDPYGGKMFKVYRKGLVSAIRYRWITIAVVVALFAVAMFGFGFLDSLFFPPSTAPQFLVEIQFREGTHIAVTEKRAAKVEDFLSEFDSITEVATAIGSGHVRFILTYNAPVEASGNYIAMLVSVDEYPSVDKIYHDVQNGLEAMYPDATVNVKKFQLGPGSGGKIQLRINGPEPAVLRELAMKAIKIMQDDPESKAIRTEWGAKVKTVRPVLADDRARRLGISRTMIAQELQTNFLGGQTGVYREGIEGTDDPDRAGG